MLVKKQLTSATSFKLTCSKSARKRNIAIQSFLEIVMVNLIGNRTFCCPIQAVIILMINKSDSRFAVIRFCYHSYDYSMNWTPLSAITIINYVNNENIFNQMLQTRDLVVIISVVHF